MLLLKLSVFGLVACFVDAIKIDVTINDRHVKSIPAGSDVILNCSVPQDDAVDRFDWLKDNQSVTDHVVTMSFQGGVWWSSLVLHNVSPVITTAMYTCRTWKNNSTKATLQRYVCVDEIVLQVKPLFLVLQAELSTVITCTVQASCEVPSLQWLNQSGNIITDKNRIASTSSEELKLRLSTVKKKDSGIYSCRAIDSTGRQVKDQKFYLVVTEKIKAYPPLMTSPRQHVDGYYGSNVTLSFSTKYTPRSSAYAEWYYEGRVLHDSPKYTLHPDRFSGKHWGNFSLTVRNLTEYDSGNYTLAVTTFEELGPGFGHVQLAVHAYAPPSARVINKASTPLPTHPSTSVAFRNETDPQADHEASRNPLLWVPIILAGIFMLIVMVVGFTCLLVKQRKKFRNYFFFQDSGRHTYREGTNDHAPSHQAEHQLHSKI